MEKGESLSTPSLTLRLHHRARHPHHPHPHSHHLRSFLSCPPLTSSANALAPAIHPFRLALAALVAPPVGLTRPLAACHFVAAHIAAVRRCRQPNHLGAHRPSFASQTSALAAARAASTLAAASQRPCFLPPPCCPLHSPLASQRVSLGARHLTTEMTSAPGGSNGPCRSGRSVARGCGGSTPTEHHARAAQSATTPGRGARGGSEAPARTSHGEVRVSVPSGCRVGSPTIPPPPLLLLQRPLQVTSPPRTPPPLPP